MNVYAVKKFHPNGGRYEFDVPASKSILNRVLLLSALSKGSVRLSLGAFGEDTRAMLECLHELGIKTVQEDGYLTVHGCGGNFPNRNASLNVKSAGTAARFLPAALAFCGGDYSFTSSLQMQNRPMEGLKALQDAGVTIEYRGKEGAFPFRLISQGVSKDVLFVNTDTSTQYLSGLCIAATAGTKPVTIRPIGGRAEGSYVLMTLNLLSDFGAKWERSEQGITVYPAENAPAEFTVEGDLSGACYFFALALLFGIKVLVKKIKMDTLQGDFKFLQLLKERGVRFQGTQEGLQADGSGITSFKGFDADFGDFSDQTLTAAALAPFASTPSVLRNVGHIRRQECDRVNAIVENINALGGKASTNGEDIFIEPIPLKGGSVNTFNDHRVAMAFTLAGLKTGGIQIENPACAKKTFENYFDIIEQLTK